MQVGILQRLRYSARSQLPSGLWCRASQLSAALRRVRRASCRQRRPEAFLHVRIAAAEADLSSPGARVRTRAGPASYTAPAGGGNSQAARNLEPPGAAKGESAGRISRASARRGHSAPSSVWESSISTA